MECGSWKTTTQGQTDWRGEASTFKAEEERAGGRSAIGGKSGRGGRIRTDDLYVPNVALYQAKLHPEGDTQRGRSPRQRRKGGVNAMGVDGASVKAGV